MMIRTRNVLSLEAVEEAVAELLPVAADCVLNLWMNKRQLAYYGNTAGIHDKPSLVVGWRVA